MGFSRGDKVYTKEYRNYDGGKIHIISGYSDETEMYRLENNEWEWEEYELELVNEEVK